MNLVKSLKFHKWIDDIKHIDFNELLASSMSISVVFIEKKIKRICRILSSSFIHGI